jgi:hypothetical protein
MLTVMVCLVWSGNSSTRRPLARRYSVMPSTDVTRSGGGGSATITEVGAGGEFFGFLAAWEVSARTMAQHAAAATRTRRVWKGIPCSGLEGARV